ncbi:MAG: glycosyl transferase family 2 [Ferruginibacter sp.]|nr:glycosyl transferase family 2 [Ferruginibacter sp.]
MYLYLIIFRTTEKYCQLKIDVIICTYNRPEKVIELVYQLGAFSKQFNSIIVVDSSDDILSTFHTDDEIVYLRSPKKNQPYQRYLGYTYSKADILLFLDDDMEVANPEFIKIIQNTFHDATVVGVAINFEDKHPDTALAAIPRSALLTGVPILKRMVGWMSGYPVLRDGKLGCCGLRGKQPLAGGITEWLSGGAFAARRSALFQNFNFQLFDLFEEKLGMGEDAIIGYGLSKRGILLYYPELLFYHNDQKDSLYSADHFAYARRVIFSRLYLSLERTRLNKGNYTIAYLHYHWYVLWRITGLWLNYLIKKNEGKHKLLIGAYEGWKLAVRFKFDRIARGNNKWT